MPKHPLSKAKDDAYYSMIRWDIIDLIPEGRFRVLDVGCGAGATLKKLKETGKAAEVWGIEINGRYEKELENALDGFYIGDVEKIGTRLQDGYFDYILFGDVLEHLFEPAKVIRQYQKYLKDNGRIIACIPNIKYFRVLSDLIMFDRFNYRGAGVLDSTHIRFFTKREIIKMFEGEGLRICRMYDKIGLPWLCHRVVWDGLPVMSFLTAQYLLTARKADADQEL
jgi:2-polyprenyl-3-methyl-5-hydroxy-6-metoxy-1,4-benzoquinol methylase